MRIFLTAVLSIFSMTLLPLIAEEISIIPRPNLVVKSEKEPICIKKHLNIKLPPVGTKHLHGYVRSTLQKEWKVAHKAGSKVTLNLELVDNPKFKINKEGYVLEVKGNTISIGADTEKGLFYGFQSLLQLGKKSADGSITIPQVVIADEPQLGWRGMHLDVSRHFYDKAFIKKYIDHLARYKMNTFHWHLVDGPGWRIEIKKYPKLTDIGAWRKDKRDKDWDWKSTYINPLGKQEGDYGGYYTQEDIKEIVKYAAERHITVVPEIEMPGHSFAILLAYPEYACPTNNIKVDGLRGKDVFCVGNPKTEQFLTDILDEVIALFPSEYIHIGADEVSLSAWKECPVCQKHKKKCGLKSDKELQSEFVKRIEKYLASKGRKLMGWDEITEDGLSKDAAVMVWRDVKFAKDAINHGHNIVLSPGTHCYFDFYQSKDRKNEPLAIGGFTPTKKVYQFSPLLEGITKEQQKQVIGAQANVWTEYIQTPEHLETMIFPRMPALAEAIWTTPKRKDWDSFQKRLKAHKAYWKANGISFYKGTLDGL